MTATDNKARTKINTLYAKYGSWRGVGECLAAKTDYKPASLGVMANRCAAGGAASLTLRKALGLHHTPDRLSSRLTPEEATAVREMLGEMGVTVTEYWRIKIANPPPAVVPPENQ